MPILCTHVHIGMKNNVAVGSFPFHRTKKPFSIFWVPKTECFVKQPTNVIFQIVQPYFSKILYHISWPISQLGYLKPIRSSLVKKTNYCQISRKSVKFELHVHDVILIIFWKNHFCVQNMLFHQRSTASVARFSLELRTFIPTALTIVWNERNKFINFWNNVKHSRGFIICDIVRIKNIKLKILQIFQKNLLKMSYHVRGLMTFRANDQCYG